MAEPLPWQTRASRGAYVQHLKDIRITDRALAGVLRDAANDAERIVRQTLGNPANVSQAVRRAQYQQSIAALRQAQAELWGEVTRATRAGMTRSAAAASQGADELLGVLLRAVETQGLGSAAEAEALLASFRRAAQAAMEDVRSRIINNIPLSDRVFRTQALSQGWIDRAVNRGIAQQLSAREIAANVKGMIRPDTPGGVNYAAKRLARTEINNAFHATDVRQAQSLPWHEAFKWELSGSHPRPDVCDDYAEDDANNLGPGIFPTQFIPSKPHPQCLCYLTSITVSPDQFNQSLLNGDYDGWLRSQGFVGISGR